MRPPQCASRTLLGFEFDSPEGLPAPRSLSRIVNMDSVDGDSTTTTFWIGGAQWAGKSSVAKLLAARHRLTLYDYDFHDARGHSRRAQEEPERFPHFAAFLRLDDEQRWVTSSPTEMATVAQHIFDERFEMVQDDLRNMPGPILAEGWGLRPRHIALVRHDRDTAVFLVPSPEFFQRQFNHVPRARTLHFPASDPERAVHNRLERNRLLADDLLREARALGFPVVSATGQPIAALASTVETVLHLSN